MLEGHDYLFRAHAAPGLVDDVASILRTSGASDGRIAGIFPGTEYVYVRYTAKSEDEAREAVENLAHEADVSWLRWARS